MRRVQRGRRGAWAKKTRREGAGPSLPTFLATIARRRAQREAALNCRTPRRFPATAAWLFLRSRGGCLGRRRLGGFRRSRGGRCFRRRSRLGRSFFRRSRFRRFRGRSLFHRRCIRRRYVALRRRVRHVAAATTRRGAGLATAHGEQTNRQNHQQQTQTLHRTTLPKKTNRLVAARQRQSGDRRRADTSATRQISRVSRCLSRLLASLSRLTQPRCTHLSSPYRSRRMGIYSRKGKKKKTLPATGTRFAEAPQFPCSRLSQRVRAKKMATGDIAPGYFLGNWGIIQLHRGSITG